MGGFYFGSSQWRKATLAISDQHFLKIQATITVKKSRQFGRQDLHISQLSSNDLEIPPLRAEAKLTFPFIIEYWS